MRQAVALVAAVGLLVGCGGDAVSPQPCDQELTTASFRVCLPADADLVTASDDTASATVGAYEVVLLERPAQPGEPDQAAYAVLADLQRQVGRSVPGAASPDPTALGTQGPVDVDGTDGAFESLDAVYDTGDVDDVATWGRGIVVDGTAGAVVVVRRFDTDTGVSAEQAEAARADARPIVVTITPRETAA